MKEHLIKLLGLQENEIEKPEIRQIIIENVSANPYQPRKNFTEENLAELSDSIKEHGILQPIVVRRKEGSYELIAGERRLRAAKLAGLSLVPAIVRSIDDQQMAELALIENLQREDLSAIEEAEAYQQLINKFNYTQDTLAKKLGKSQSAIANKMRLLKLPEQVKKEIIKGVLTERHARALLKIETPEEQIVIMQQIINSQLNVRETDEIIKNLREITLVENDNITREIKPQRKSNKRTVMRVYKDLRLFKNSLKKLINFLKDSGVKVKVEEIEDDASYKIQIIVKKEEANTNII